MDNGSHCARKSNGSAAPGLAACVALFTLAVYVRTMAPTITWRNAGADSGEFVTAALNLGVPHPTGYPLYTILAHTFSALPGDPGRNVTFLSAVAGAFAVGLLFWTAHQWTVTGSNGGSLCEVTAAWAAAGSAGFGELLWSQGTIAEVYALNALVVTALLAVMLCSSSHLRPYLLAILFGLGLAHHVTVVWLLLALWPYTPVVRRWLTAKRVVGLALCLLPGLLIYLYVPIRAAAHPVPNWGQADELASFIWLVSGVVYHPYLSMPTPPVLLQRLSGWASIWVRDLGVIGLALALLGLWRGLDTDRRFSLSGLTYVMLLSAYAICYTTVDSYLYLIPATMVMALWLARGASFTLGAIQGWARRHSQRRVMTVSAIVLLVALPLASLAMRYEALDLSDDYEAYDYAEKVLEAAAPGAIVISGGDEQTFALWYLRYGLKKRLDVAVVDGDLLDFDWYRHEVAARHVGLSALAGVGSAQEALALMVQESACSQPVHLTYEDAYLFGLAQWIQEDPLFTLVRD
jgi:hypothetical protein